MDIYKKTHKVSFILLKTPIDMGGVASYFGLPMFAKSEFPVSRK